MKLIYIILGFCSLIVGILGIILPLLPSTPFLLLAAFLFAKSSEKFHNWLINTKIYKEFVVDIKNKELSKSKKIKLFLSLSLVFFISFYFCPNKIGKIVIMIVYLGHIYYFFIKKKE